MFVDWYFLYMLIEHTHTHTHTHPHKYALIHTLTHTHIHAHTHTHTHTHKHSYTHENPNTHTYALHTRVHTHAQARKLITVLWTVADVDPLRIAVAVPFILVLYTWYLISTINRQQHHVVQSTDRTEIEYVSRHEVNVIACLKQTFIEAMLFRQCNISSTRTL